MKNWKNWLCIGFLAWGVAAQAAAPKPVRTVEGITEYRLENGLRVLERVVMTGGRRVTFLPNLRGSLAFYRVTRG